MILGRKYVFETKRTRTWRLIKSAIILFTLGILSIVTIAVYIPIYGKQQVDVSKKIFFQKEPDLIAVYTGDDGRVERALKAAQRYRSSKILISGVHAANSLKILVQEQGGGMSVEEFLASQGHKVELDYWATSTIENVISTLKYLKLNPGLKHVLIISSDYHMLRIRLILNHLVKADSDYQFYFEAVKTDFSDKRSIKLLLSEISKIIKTLPILWTEH